MAQVSQTVERFTKPFREGDVMHKIEDQTARIPSIGLVGLAAGSMLGSAIIALAAERKEWANFVGLWAPSFLLIGIFNKLVRIERMQHQLKKVA